MPHESLKVLIGVAIALAGLTSARAQFEGPSDVEGARIEGPPQGETSSRCWWMPDSGCCAKKNEISPGWPAHQTEAEVAPQSSPRTLIEEVELLLDTPRFDAPAARTGTLFDANASDPLIKPSGDQFSRVWTDGAPLLLYDWSGKSDDPSAPANLRQDGLKRVASANSSSTIADLTANVKFRERDAMLDPGVHTAWETDQTVKVPFAGTMFFFNQVSGSTPDVDQQQYKWLNKAGVGLKLKPWLLQEVQLRTGPAVRYDDTGTLTKGQSPEHSELFLEAVTQLPLPVVGPINVEYSSYAVPAANSTDHTNQINQDFKLALPVGSGQFQVGAKYKWESASATPWMDRMEVYLGVQNKW